MLLLRHWLGVSATLLAMTATLSPAAAQPAADTYRAEIVVIERKVSPDSVIEQMASRAPAPATGLPEQLWVEDANGSRVSSVNLAPRSQMHLHSAATRLENSGRYRVLMSAAWYQSFPPDYSGQPMHVSIGDWLPAAAHRAVEGQITIDRKRYLHVNVALNHWRPVTTASTAVTTPPSGDPADITTALAADGSPVAEPRAQLLTWIRETRRMRSEEVHFLDSPTIGVLVFFKKMGD
ncbi:hypothetical protein BG841_12055 [Marinobacter sp. X15-166B]|nr:hypothetical protein BG841_12055 [Marinobacter sp. X15-166B]